MIKNIEEVDKQKLMEILNKAWKEGEASQN